MGGLSAWVTYYYLGWPFVVALLSCIVGLWLVIIFIAVKKDIIEREMRG